MRAAVKARKAEAQVPSYIVDKDDNLPADSSARDYRTAIINRLFHRDNWADPLFPDRFPEPTTESYTRLIFWGHFLNNDNMLQKAIAAGEVFESKSALAVFLDLGQASLRVSRLAYTSGWAEIDGVYLQAAVEADVVLALSVLEAVEESNRWRLTSALFTHLAKVRSNQFLFSSVLAAHGKEGHEGLGDILPEQEEIPVPTSKDKIKAGWDSESAVLEKPAAKVILENAALSASAGGFCWARAVRLFAGAVAAGAEARLRVWGFIGPIM
ncbi:unnamed protein product [Symbiodinium sp. KB8]|nr:unnamed protein product [Symbiodinium sp. KB8]